MIWLIIGLGAVAGLTGFIWSRRNRPQYVSQEYQARELWRHRSQEEP